MTRNVTIEYMIVENDADVAWRRLDQTVNNRGGGSSLNYCYAGGREDDGGAEGGRGDEQGGLQAHQHHPHPRPRYERWNASSLISPSDLVSSPL